MSTGTMAPTRLWSDARRITFDPGPSPMEGSAHRDSRLTAQAACGDSR